MKSYLELNELKPFIGYFLGEIDVDFGRLIVCEFDGWLDLEGYENFIVNISSENKKIINDKRRFFFSRFIGRCVVYDWENNTFREPTDVHHFWEMCEEGIDDSERFVLLDWENYVAIQTGYELTDICFFTESSTIEDIKSYAKEAGLHTFIDSNEVID
jgi:hypothetical protein